MAQWLVARRHSPALRGASGRLQDFLARVKPLNCFWTLSGPGKSLAALQGTTAHLTLLEQSGTI